ncbi:MAG: sugar ABC transporter substrate-binding protein [Deinococcota bacterium]
MFKKNLSRRTMLKLMAASGGALALGSRVAFSQDSALAYAADVALTDAEIETIRDMNLRFGFNTNHRTDDFINLLIEGGEQTASDYGIELLVGEANFDAAKQLADVETLIQQEVDGIFLVAVDFNAISPAIVNANEAGIPVVIVGGPPADGDVLTVMNSTSYDGCYESCKYLIDSVGGSGKIGVISIPLALSTIRDRETGTLDAISESGMELVGLQPVWTQDDALAAAENMIQANPDLTAIFATWSLAINGTLAAIDASGNDIKLGGYDAERAGFEAFDAGDPFLVSLSGQQAIVQGKAGLDALCKSILGESVAGEIVVPTLLVTSDNYQARWDDLYPGVDAPWS